MILSLRLLLLAGLAMLLALARPAAALNPATRLQDFNHTIWSTRDGAPPSITSMAQTPDGWLWLGTPVGLYRFDGVRFERYVTRDGAELPRPRIYTLLAQPNGDLLICYIGGGVSVLHANGELEQLAPLDSAIGPVESLAVDGDGSLWAAGPYGLHHYVNGAWSKIAEGRGLPSGATTTVLVDQYRQLWVSGSDSLYRLDRASGRFVDTGMRHSRATLLSSPDGRLWLAEPDRLRLVPQPPAPPTPQPRAERNNQQESRWAGQFDRDGNLWALQCPRGLCLMANAGRRQERELRPSLMASDKFDQPLQMGSLLATAMLEDREGNLWIATQTGLERLRENALLPVRLPNPSNMLSMALDGDGRLWAADLQSEQAWQLRPGAAPLPDRHGRYQLVQPGLDGELLLATRRSIERRKDGKSTTIALPPGPDGKPMDLQVYRLVDDGRRLWMVSGELGLQAWEDGRWKSRKDYNLPPRIFLLAAAGPGQLWLGSGDGSVNFYDNDKLTRYDVSEAGYVTGIFSHGGEVVVGGVKGLAVLRQDRFQLLAAGQPEVLRNVSGLAVTADGDRWLNGGKGLVHIRSDDWRAAVDHPGTPLHYRLYDVVEGYPGQAALDLRLPSLAAQQDGRLWAATTEGIVTLDSAALRHNPVPPLAQVKRLASGALAFGARPGLELPPLARNIEIDFAAPGLGRPERMRVQYQLEGVDEGWQEAGARRTAYYTGLAPGPHRFRVRAANEDGLTGPEALLEFGIAPAWHQAWWFRIPCAAAVALLLAALYRARLRAATRRVNERLLARMSERDRSASTVHDSLLQAVQGLVLRLQAYGNGLPADGEARAGLEPLLDQAGQLLAEGSAQARGLREGRGVDLVQALGMESQLLREQHPDTVFLLRVEGAHTGLQPQVAEEVCAIAREALRAAFSNAGAGRVELSLDYGVECFSVTVAGDGRAVPGNAGGADGVRQWGLQGVRERARRLGAQLELGAAADGGTAVTLRVPAATAYDGAGSSWLRKLVG
jgi:ligand-binding sensor domain-containing protein